MNMNLSTQTPAAKLPLETIERMVAAPSTFLAEPWRVAFAELAERRRAMGGDAPGIWPYPWPEARTRVIERLAVTPNSTDSWTRGYMLRELLDLRQAELAMGE